MCMSHCLASTNEDMPVLNQGVRKTAFGFTTFVPTDLGHWEKVCCGSRAGKKRRETSTVPNMTTTAAYHTRSLSSPVDDNIGIPDDPDLHIFRDDDETSIREISIRDSSIISDPCSDSSSSSTSSSSSFSSSSSSSISRDSSPSQTPHMFLSYAKPQPYLVIKQSPQTSETGGPNLLSKQRRGSSTPHLFLPCAGNSGDDAKQQQRYSDWCRSSEAFESCCKEYMEIDQQLPCNQAASVASALRKAAEEAASNPCDLNEQYELYASIVDRSLASNDPAACSENSGTASTKPSTNPSLQDQVSRQQKEIDFLRCAMKQLILASGQSEEFKKEEPVDTDYPRDIVCRIPSKIEFVPRQKDAPEDDASELLSELTPCVEDNIQRPATSMGLVVKPYSQPLAKIPIPSPIPRQAWVGPRGVAPLTSKCLPPVPMLDTDAPNGQSGAFVTYLQTMQLVNNLRATKDKPDLLKGEIQGNRARGMRFQLTFHRRGITVTGSYSGAIRNGVPHGPGVLRFDNRDIYIGEFRDGMLDGDGKLFSRKQSRLVTLRGRFQKNEFVGFYSPSDTVSAGAA